MKLHGKRADDPAFATTPFGAFVMLGGAVKITIILFYFEIRMMTFRIPPL